MVSDQDDVNLTQDSAVFGCRRVIQVTLVKFLKDSSGKEGSAGSAWGGIMDFGSALAEFVDLLTVASQALTRIAQNERSAGSSVDRLSEVEAIARRLHEIGDELRVEALQVE